MKTIERLFESFLWNSRLMVIAAVIASLAAAVAVLFMASVDAWIMISHLGEYLSPELTTEGRADLRSETVTHVVEIIDGYLLATVLLIFALAYTNYLLVKLNKHLMYMAHQKY